MTTITLKAPQTWWESTTKLCALSTESSRGEMEDSFLSCILFEVGDKGVFIHAESALSTTYIHPKDVSFSGVGRFLVNANRLKSYISGFPRDCDITLEYTLEEEKVRVFTKDSGDIEFSLNTFAITADDAVPYADSEVPEGASTIVVDSQELMKKYRVASSMAKPMDKEALVGQDPLSSCSISISDKGVQMYSLMSSCAETLLCGQDTHIGESSVLLSSPDITPTRISAFPQGDVFLSIFDGKRVFLSNEECVVAFSSLNTGNMKTQANFTTVMNLFASVWKNRVASVQVPAKEFFASLSRTSTVGAENVNISVARTAMGIEGYKNKETVFKQSIPSSIVWIDNPDNPDINVDEKLGFMVDPGILRKISPSVSDVDNLHFDLVCKNNGRPWALLVYQEEEFDSEDPHNFFMINIAPPYVV